MNGAASYMRLVSGVSEQLGLAEGDRPAVADVVLPALVEAFGAAVGTIAAFRAPSTLHLVGLVGLDDRPATRETWEQFDVSAGVPLAEAARTGEPVWVPDIEQVRHRYPAWPADAISRSACVVPMRSGGRLVGVLGLSWTSPREFTEVDKDTLVSVGGIAAAACLLDGRLPERRLGVLDSDTDRDDVHLAQLVRSSSTAVPRTVGTVAAAGAPTLSWLVEAPNHPALAVACEGVLALARRHGSPPAVAARHVAELCEEMDGEAAGVALQVGPGAGWVAVAAIGACLVLTAPVLAGPGVTSFSSTGTAPDEHVLVPDGEGASVLALLVAPGLDDDRTSELVRVARREFDRHRGMRAEDVLSRVGERLGEHGLDGCLLGALALVVAPRAELPPLHRRLPARPLAAPLARRFALAALGPEPDDDIVFRLGLAVDELVTNATRHSDDTIDVTVTAVGDGVRIEVSDDDDRLPDGAGSASGADELPESGRGLVLVGAVVDRWGVLPRTPRGKTVWAHVSR